MNDRHIRLQLDVSIPDESLAIIAEAFKRAVCQAFEGCANPRLSLPRRHAHYSQQPPMDAGLDEEDRLLIDTKQAAQLLHVSTRTLFKMYKQKLMPEPIRLGGRFVRWSLEELREWVKHGCPPRREWQFPPAPWLHDAAQSRVTMHGECPLRT
ncbi:MAG: AlpA family phage regulatory protein [Thermoguttaceae bacterium]|nr:AlpA family phage regulatory protein [Thermoguttaceae bacterium]